MELLIYRNKRDKDKYLEIRKYKCSHYRVRQLILHLKGDAIWIPSKGIIIEQPEDVVYYTGSPRNGKRKLDGWKVFGASRKINNGLKTLLEDYELVDCNKEPRVYESVKTWKGWSS